MSKNKFKCDPARIGTIAGASYSINTDGSVTVNGTPTGASGTQWIISLGYYTFTSTTPMMVTGASTEINSAIRLNSGSTNLYERGTGLQVVRNQTMGVGLAVYSGTTYDNVTFYPMIRLAGIDDDTWEPYSTDGDTINIGKKAQSLDISDLLNGYSAVRIITGTDSDGKDIVIETGETSGRVLTFKNEFGTPEMARNILESIRGYQYRPLTASAAMLDPAAELGDAIIVNGVYAGLYHVETDFGRLMATNLSAPVDEEVIHEYGYDTSTDREYKRFVGRTGTALTINSEAITAEAVRATEAEGELDSRLTITADSISAEINRATIVEGQLSTRITATADSISAEISRAQREEESLSTRITANASSITSEITRAKQEEYNLSSRITQTASAISAQVSAVESNKLDKTGGSSSTFGWTLTATAFTLNSSSTEVFRADRNGIKIKGNAEVTGKITATSGYIGNGSSGFTIGSTAIYNGKTSLSDSNNGIYISTSGIALGKDSAFKVTNKGAVTASNLSITGGSININDNFKVTSTGAVTASNLSITGGSINLGNNFKVTSTGAVTASNLSITGGSINIGGAFRVDSSGALYATSGTFSGNVYAGNIQYGGSYGTFDGNGLTPYSVAGYQAIEPYSVTGGYNGNLGYSTVDYGNTAFTGTLDQVATNAANIDAIAGYFVGTASFNSLTAHRIQLFDSGSAAGYGFLYLDYIDNVPVVKWNY